MICPQCGTENPEGARFCMGCATRLILICAACGAELPPHATLCFECGAEVGRAPAAPSLEWALRRLIPKEYAERLLATQGQAPAERRTVTILFSDVKGSTAMAETLDPEDVLEIMDGAFDVLIQPVYRYEGTLARLMGDAVLAFFGAPLAHEDDPERACRAALDILAGAQAYAARLEAERGIRGFDVRVGIHTGLVVVGEVGSDLRVEYTAMGDAVNLAARLEQAAEPGTVLISEATHRLVAPLFDTQRLAPIAVKGKAEPVAVYRVLAGREVVVKPRGIAGLASPLVGREAEFAALREALIRLEGGEGGVVTIVGEAGIGKSRLVAELRNHAVGAQHAAPLQWLEGRCLSYGSSLAYLVWLDILRALLGVTLDDGPEDVRAVLQRWVSELCAGQFEAVYPYLARLMSLPVGEEVAERLEELTGRELRDRTFQAVEALLACAARQRPLVVVCEDLHWADATSLELLEQLLPLSETLPVLFVCVFRPVQEHPCWGLRERLAAGDGERHTDLRLASLTAAESQSLVTNLLCVDELPPALKERILARAEGNPFYLEEILRSLIDQRAILQNLASGHWQATVEVEQIVIPDTLEGVLVARIDRLEEETRRVLQLASVIGRIFLYRVLAEIAAAEAAAFEQLRLEQRLKTLQQEELIRERARLPELEYIFKHDLTREAAYNGLLKRKRRATHRQAAEALERLFPERLEEMLGLLAHHWEQAGVANRAVDCLQQAGDQARLAYALDEAVDYYQRALVFLRRGEEPRDTARLLMKLGLTYSNAFRYEEARQAHDEGFRLWQQAAETAPARPPPAPHALRLAPFDPVTLDPAKADWELFSGLVELTPEADVVPDVAYGWDILDDGHTYVFHLRGDVQWSDGVQVSAGDFEFAWKRVLDPATGSPFANLLYEIEGARAFHQGETSDPGDIGVRARDRATLMVELESPVAYFLQLVAHPATLPVPRHVVQELGPNWAEPENLVTNGPFQLDSWQKGQPLVLVRNPRYHGLSSGNVQRVELFGRAMMNDRELVSLYEAGDLDHLYIGILSDSEFIRAYERNTADFVRPPLAAVFYYGFDVTRPPFDDIRVRRAFALATDISIGCPGPTIIPPARGGLVPPGMPAHQPGIGLPYAPEGARQLLAEAGYPGGQGFPEIVSRVHPGGWGEGFQKVQQSNWVEGLGIKMRWATIPLSEMHAGPLDERPHAFVIFTRAAYPDPYSILPLDTLRNWTGWSNETYTSLVEEARHTFDQGQRMKLYKQADRILIEEAVLVPTDYGGHPWLVKPWVTSFPCSPLPAKSMYWKDVIIEPH